MRTALALLVFLSGAAALIWIAGALSREASRKREEDRELRRAAQRWDR